MAKSGIYLKENRKKEEYQEMLTICANKGLHIYLTDIIFDKDKQIKAIKSELPKNVLKSKMNKLIDEFYERYKSPENLKYENN